MTVVVFSLVSFFCSLALLYLGITAFTMNRNNKTNRVFLIYCLTAGTLAFFEFMARQSIAYQRGYLWINLQQLAPLVTIVSLHFIGEYTKFIKNRNSAYFHTLLYVPFIVYVFFLIFTDFFRINAAQAPWGYSHGGSEHGGLAPYITVLWMAGTNTATIIISFIYYRRQKNRSSRAAAFFIFIAMLIPFIGAFFETVVFKALGKFPEIITLFTFVSALFIAYSIHRHRLFEINPEMAAANILKTVDNLILLIDTDGYITTANPAAHAALGLTGNKLIGENISSLFMNGFDPNIPAGPVISGASPGPVSNFETCMITSKGTPLYVMMSVSSVTDSGGIILGHVVAATNINQRIELENNLLSEINRADTANTQLAETNKKLTELDRMKKNFIAIVSHELRTPLTSIKGFLSFLSHGVGGNLSERQREFTDTMNSNVEKLLKLINELLDFSKIDSGTFSVKKQNADLLITARNAIIEMTPIASKKNIKIVDLMKTASRPCVFDDTRISQVIINLLSNSVKYTYSNTSIFVTLEEISGPGIILPAYMKTETVRSGKYYLLSVRDEGPGMDPKYCRKIFDQFFQIEDANTRKHEGVGLGLNISASIIKSHDGYIWADSKGKDTGAVFSFLLPVE